MPTEPVYTLRGEVVSYTLHGTRGGGTILIGHERYFFNKSELSPDYGKDPQPGDVVQFCAGEGDEVGPTATDVRLVRRVPAPAVQAPTPEKQSPQLKRKPCQPEDELPSAAFMEGKVTWYNRIKQYGFIEAAGVSYHFHVNNVYPKARRDELAKGMTVDFIPYKAQKGPAAWLVRIPD